MVNYARHLNMMAYLIGLTKSESCKKYLSGLSLTKVSKLIFFISLTLPKLTLAGEGVIIPMDLSSWSYKGSKLECNLIHSNIPQGKFYFRAEPNDRLFFVANLHESENKWQSASLHSQSAPWSNELMSKLLSSLTFSQSQQRFEFLEGTEVLLDDIERGIWVTLSLIGSDASSRSKVTLPTVQIRNALASFQACRERLPKLSFSQARDLVLPFQFGQKALNASQLQTISALESYVFVDNRITKILIDGHTDNVGSDLVNLTISRQRAEQVANALVAQGIDRKLIEVRAHGSRYPIASNNTTKGQAKNRRVTLRLVRDNERVIAKNHEELKQHTQQKKVKVQ
ncbi:OmpA family protein [Vibrio alfacsensis]|uniref:OmpA family protein n=1 Tax=Vibrio alfacsensis TaxID=1074311 RepID=UPI00406991F8